MTGPGLDEEFTAFVRDASPALGRTAWLLCGDRDLAADLVQATLVKTFRAWRRIAPEARLAYARRVLAHENIDRWRRRHGEVAVAEVFDRPDAAPTPDALVAERDRVTRMLAALPDTQRRVVVLRYYDDLSERQVAETLGLSVAAVKSATHRALTALRTHESPEGVSA
ncbi:SigE family RNA polymerase sigma factor [Propioniciclava soli]|uniref:SigE family RNA polymerase sigma factor n=1 Tax=Propioniciclava soli TaxID=2775081 RepID=A0ABZ3C885_9ACTN|nr:SigE family RNA polymerase sigma factor [Propioniciclava soli]